ncbi:hypothetical protein Tco_0280301 [Tanacetum coccineum]
MILSNDAQLTQHLLPRPCSALPHTTFITLILRRTYCAPQSVTFDLAPPLDGLSLSHGSKHGLAIMRYGRYGAIKEAWCRLENTGCYITNIVIPVNVDNEDDEITDEVFELRRRVKGKNVEETRISPIPSLTRSPRNISILVSSDTEKLQELTVTHPTPSSGMIWVTYLQHLRKGSCMDINVIILLDNLHDVMMETLPSLVKEKVTKQVKKEIQNAIDNAIPSLVDASADPLLQQQDIAIWLALQMKFEKTQVPQTACRYSAIRTRDQDDPHDDAHPEGENNAKRQKTSEYEAYVFGESSSGQENVEEPGPSTSGNQEQDDEFDFWTDSYASDDDEIPTKKVTQDIMEEISLTIDEAKLKKMADAMLRQRCTSGDEHQDPEAPALSLINQDLLYLKKGNSGPEKIVLSLHKFPVIVFNDDDIEERNSKWVNKCIKKFNPYARYGVENWKNPHAKIFYIRRQKEPGRPKEEIYSNSKIVQVIKTFWELGHEHKFITEIVARRANDCIVSITEPDYKNLNKNDIEDMYLLIMNNKERVHDFQLGIESYQQKINLTAPTITFPGIEEYDVFSIVYEPVHGIIYTNSKKEKRVMRPSEIHKFCDATLRRTLEGLKSYYNDVKYGYVQKELTNDEVEFLKLFEEEIEVRLNYRDQMRRWEMYATYNFGVPPAATFLALHPQDNNIIAIGKGYKDVHFEAKIATGEGINVVSVQLLVNALLTSMWEK